MCSRRTGRSRPGGWGRSSTLSSGRSGRSCARPAFTRSRDVLGQFLVARERWLRSDRLASAAIRARDEKLAKEWTAVQSSYFRQCRQCAEVMGLSISSRCRLVVPEVLANAAKDEGEEDEFTRALKARQARAAGG